MLIPQVTLGSSFSRKKSPQRHRRLETAGPPGERGMAMMVKKMLVKIVISSSKEIQKSWPPSLPNHCHHDHNHHHRHHPRHDRLIFFEEQHWPPRQSLTHPRPRQGVGGAAAAARFWMNHHDIDHHDFIVIRRIKNFAEKHLQVKNHANGPKFTKWAPSFIGPAYGRVDPSDDNDDDGSEGDVDDDHQRGRQRWSPKARVVRGTFWDTWVTPGH